MSNAENAALPLSTRCAELTRIEALAVHESVRTRAGVVVHWGRFGQGTGAPLVLLHGGHGNWSHWVRNVEALSAQRSVWVADMPGYGRSDSLPEGADVDLLIATLADSINLLFGADASIDLAGFSFGGLVAATLATRRPVSHLMLLGSAGHGGGRRPYPPLRTWRRAPDAEQRRADFDFNLHAFMLHQRTPDDLALCAYEDACLHTRFRSRRPDLAGRLVEALAQVTANKLLLWGDQDVTFDHPVAYSDRLRQAGIAHRFESITNAGHWVQFEQADVVNRMLNEWLA